MLTIVVLGFAAALLIIVGCQQCAQQREVEKSWVHKVETVMEQNAIGRQIIDSLQDVIDTQQAFRARIDSLDRVIARDPRYRPGAYRDSTTEAKLDFIRGHR